MYLRTSCCIIKHFNITLILEKQTMLQEHHCNLMTDANFKKLQQHKLYVKINGHMIASNLNI